MYDLAYCKIEECTDWTCEKAETCKRNKGREEIPQGTPYHLMNVFYVCKDTNCSLYVQYNKEV